VEAARKVWPILLVTVEIEAAQEWLKQNCQNGMHYAVRALLDLFASTFCLDWLRLNVRCG